MEPIITDNQGDWYSMKDFASLTQRTPERIRQHVHEENPPVIKDKSRGVILYRVADGYEISGRGGIRLSK